jgi:hypothetical protein
MTGVPPGSCSDVGEQRAHGQVERVVGVGELVRSLVDDGGAPANPYRRAFLDREDRRDGGRHGHFAELAVELSALNVLPINGVTPS